MNLVSPRSVLASPAQFLRATAAAQPTAAQQSQPAIEPFHGPHQGGIVTRQQAHTIFATFDLTAKKRADLRALLRRWTDAAATLCAGAPSEEAHGMPPAHLTVTFGFGAGLFVKHGKDRYGLAAQRPEALVDLPVFKGDQLVPDRCGGDLSVQACADDPQTAFHAVCLLAHLACGTAHLRWVQSGFVPSLVGRTPRGSMANGSNAPDVGTQANMASVVWVGEEGPAWMRGGTYVVPRRIRISLEHCDPMPASFRTRSAPLRFASVSVNGAQILRRGYSYNDGASSGLLFVAYQKDPRSGFIKMFDRMAKFDVTNQFIAHTGGGIFACPPGVERGDSIGSGLFV